MFTVLLIQTVCWENGWDWSSGILLFFIFIWFSILILWPALERKKTIDILTCVHLNEMETMNDFCGTCAAVSCSSTNKNTDILLSHRQPGLLQRHEENAPRWSSVSTKAHQSSSQCLCYPRPTPFLHSHTHPLLSPFSSLFLIFSHPLFFF